MCQLFASPMLLDSYAPILAAIDLKQNNCDLVDSLLYIGAYFISAHIMLKGVERIDSFLVSVVNICANPTTSVPLMNDIKVFVVLASCTICALLLTTLRIHNENRLTTLLPSTYANATFVVHSSLPCTTCRICIIHGLVHAS